MAALTNTTCGESTAMLTERDQRFVRTLVREHGKEAAKKGTTLWPATVVATSPAGSPATITLDGDSNTEIPAQNLLGQGLYDGQRVMVTLVPPHGVFVTHSISAAAGLASQVVLDADTNVISLTVPSGVSEVEVRASLRSNVSALTDIVAVRFNSDTTSSYLSAYLYHAGTTPKAGTQADVGRFPAGQCSGNTAASALRSPLRLDCMDVANTAAHKEGTAESSVAGTTRYSTGWRWPSTAAVTLIELRPWFGTAWKAGSTARLYSR